VALKRCSPDGRALLSLLTFVHERGDPTSAPWLAGARAALEYARRMPAAEVGRLLVDWPTAGPPPRCK
jgi:hypothetical protein